MNRSTKPILRIKIPHFRASVFFAPQGWSTACSGLVGVGVKVQAGWCAASASGAEQGLAPGRSGEFGMQLAAGGAKRGRGEAIVQFADGLEIRVGGVEVPQAETSGDKLTSLIGLSAAALVVILFQFARRKRRHGDSLRS